MDGDDPVHGLTVQFSTDSQLFQVFLVSIQLILHLLHTGFLGFVLSAERSDGLNVDFGLFSQFAIRFEFKLRHIVFDTADILPDFIEQRGL